MKSNIHPQFYNNSTVSCACGNSFVTGSTRQEFHTEVCSSCHPFYTGKQKLLDTAGRVDKFKTKQIKAADIKSKVAPKKPRKTRGEK
ncbi:MAG: 50S ribosomal protein L31 [Candidatus Doudnabacteria bacterium]|nr:50S ribosomal protein L31 [Candidatus Doudnabacteria bacterium]